MIIMRVQLIEPLKLCNAPIGTDESINLTPTAWALEWVAENKQLLVHSNEHGNADIVLKRYNGTNRLWGGDDFVWWCLLSNLTGVNVAEFFAETEDKLVIDD